MTNPHPEDHMATTDDGGPAMPTHAAYDNTPGMTLRDFFAAHALPGLLGARVSDDDGATVLLFWSRAVGLSWNSSGLPGRLADLAYAVADAMLARRNKP